MLQQIIPEYIRLARTRCVTSYRAVLQAVPLSPLRYFSFRADHSSPFFLGYSRFPFHYSQILTDRSRGMAKNFKESSDFHGLGGTRSKLPRQQASVRRSASWTAKLTRRPRHECSQKRGCSSESFENEKLDKTSSSTERPWWQDSSHQSSPIPRNFGRSLARSCWNSDEKNEALWKCDKTEVLWTLSKPIL